MKNYFRKMRCLLVIVFSAQVWAGEEPLYDLTTCLKTAFRQNPELLLAEQDVKIGNLRRRSALVALLAAVNVKADETRGKADETNRTPSFLQRTYGVQVTQPLFNGGKLWATREQASVGADLARLQLEKSRLDVHHATVEAYWRVVALQRSVSLYQEVLQQLQDDLEKAVQHEFSKARPAKIELLATRVQNREAEAALAESQEELMSARSALLDVLGERRWIEFRVPTEMPDQRIQVKEEEVLQLARGHRPEIKINEYLLSSARLSRRISASRKYPKVDLNGFYGRSASAYIETDPLTYRKDWNAGVSASWPFGGSTLKYTAFKEKTSPRLGESTRTETESQSLSLGLGDALSSSVEVLEGRKTYLEEQWKYEKEIRNVEVDARRAYQRYQAALHRLGGANARLEESLQQLKETRSLLQEDRAHLGDLAEAQFRVATSKANLGQAQMNYSVALSALNRAVGLTDYFGSAR